MRLKRGFSMNATKKKNIIYIYIYILCVWEQFCMSLFVYVGAC